MLCWFLSYISWIHPLLFISLVIGTIHCYIQEPRTGASIYQAYYKYYLDGWMDK